MIFTPGTSGLVPGASVSLVGAENRLFTRDIQDSSLGQVRALQSYGKALKKVFFINS